MIKMTDNPVMIFQSMRVDLPILVADDINHRMESWIQMGGSVNDRYMWAQIDYAQKVLDFRKKKGE